MSSKSVLVAGFLVPDFVVRMLPEVLAGPACDSVEIVRIQGYVREDDRAWDVVVTDSYDHEAERRMVDAIKQTSPDVIVLRIRNYTDLKSIPWFVEARPEAPEIEAKLRRLASREHLIPGASPMLDLYERILQVAVEAAPVVIEGEAGTDHEAVARAIHYHSMRRDGPFYRVECASRNEDALVFDLFGEGVRPTPGSDEDKFARARGGTLFLIDLDRLPASHCVRLAQKIRGAKDLRVLAWGCPSAS